MRKNMRDSTVRWVDKNWLVNMVSGYGHAANTSAWNFDINTYENIQFTEYALNQHYDFHIDTFEHSEGMRKVSVVIQLSDDKDYEGGDFQFQHPDESVEVVPALRKRGTVLAFPSWYRHRVTPVTKGTRYTLVTWLSGPALV